LSYGHHVLLRTASIANGLGIVNSRNGFIFLWSKYSALACMGSD